MGPTGVEILKWMDHVVKKDFDSDRRILSFDEYLVAVAEQPRRQLRGSAQYVLDMMDSFGEEPARPEPVPGPAQPTRFKLFNHAQEGFSPKVIGQEQVQHHLHRSIKAFTRTRLNNKLVLLHGPNGSAKSSLIHSLMAGMELYSHTPEGTAYTFNWIFPLERVGKPGMGLNAYPAKAAAEPTASYAKLPDEEVAARFPCDLKDHPLLLIPRDFRRETLVKLLGEKQAATLWEQLPAYLTQGDLCHRCRQIFDTLLGTLGGDYRKVLNHIQVERFYFSRRYRKGLVTIEPQMHVDANYQQLTMNKNISLLPSSLQALNFFTLSGDLVDGNRGLIEYSDLLKRPVDSFKYLLTACETGSVNVGTSIAYLDTVMVGSTNEVQLDAFKEFPDFASFKARIELVRVPYLLAVSEEQKIYTPELESIAGEKHVAPHVGWSVALWAILSRLKKPNSINYPPTISTIISNLTPLEKAKLYDQGDLPGGLSLEDRKLLRSSIRKLREEYANVPYYEGRMGASARELKSMLFDAAQNGEFPCLSPLALLRELEEFVKRVTEHDFLKQDVKDGYHDAQEFILTVKSEYTNLIDREVRDSIGLYDSAQWEDFLRRYIQQISLVLKKEKSKNPITGKLEDPDHALIDEFERIVDVPTDEAERDAFRLNLISQVGAWSLDHPKETVVYAKVFPEYWRKLEKHYYESQKALLTKMSEALVVYDPAEDTEADMTTTYQSPSAQAASVEGKELARRTVANMQTKYGYCPRCAKEVIGFLLKQRY